MCVMCVCVRERERGEERNTREIKNENTQEDCILQRRLTDILQSRKRLRYIVTLSSLTTDAHESWGMWTLISYVS